MIPSREREREIAFTTHAPSKDNEYGDCTAKDAVPTDTAGFRTLE